LTNSKPRPYNYVASDFSDAAGAPAIEIEITPEIIKAGFQVLCNSGIADSYLRADRTLVAEIFLAMLAKLPPHSHPA
jgi:hypothetical protein